MGSRNGDVLEAGASSGLRTIWGQKEEIRSRPRLNYSNCRAFEAFSAQKTELAPQSAWLFITSSPEALYKWGGPAMAQPYTIIDNILVDIGFSSNF